MLIRSQDKTIITTDLNLYILKREYGDYIIVRSNSDNLGIYSNEEKAHKVFDMIQKAYNSIETMKIDKEAWRDNHYFQMPQDDEVMI